MMPQERERLGQINWALGQQGPYRFTPKEQARMAEIARKIIRELKEELEGIEQ